MKPITVNVDTYLALNKFQVDEGNPHIQIAEGAPSDAFLELVRVCPAGLYKVAPDGTQHVDFAGCLECGTCRIVGLGGVVQSWRYPGPTMGVEYRYG